MLLKLLPLALSLFTFTGAISSSIIAKEIHDHRDEPSNAQIEPIDDFTYNFDLTFHESNNDYLSVAGTSYDTAKYNLYVTYTQNFKKTRSTFTFKSLEIEYYTNGVRQATFDDSFDAVTLVIQNKLLTETYFHYYLQFSKDTDSDDNDGYLYDFILYDEANNTLGSFSRFVISNPVYNYFLETETSDMVINLPFALSSYQDGFDDGEAYVLANLDDYNLYTEAQLNAYGQTRYNQGVSTANVSFMNLFGAIADTPVIMIRNLFSFDLFGMSALTIFMSLLTALIVIHFVRKVV